MSAGGRETWVWHLLALTGAGIDPTLDAMHDNSLRHVRQVQIETVLFVQESQAKRDTTNKRGMANTRGMSKKQERHDEQVKQGTQDKTQQTKET